MNTHTPTDDKIVEKAHKKAEKIIQEAVLKAEKILSDVDLITEEMRGELKASLTTLINRNAQLIDEITKKAVEEMLADFKSHFEKEREDVKNQLQNMLQEELSEMKKQVAQEKEQRIAQFEKQLVEKANALAQQMIGRALSPEEQEKLVIEALERAKKEGFFTIDSQK